MDRGGGSPALIRGKRALSYAELEARANRLARYLRTLGVGPGCLVGLCLERCELPIIAILACLKAGGAYVPLEPAYPDERLRFILGEAGIKVVLTQRALGARLERLFAGSIVALDQAGEKIAGQCEQRLTRADTGVAPSDVCYVLYTSGTSGRPKGVVTEHRNVTHFVAAFNNACTTTPQDRIYQGFSLGFDGSVEEIWMAFSNGAALLVGSKHTPKFGNELARYLTRAGVTYLSTVPTLLSTMTEDVPCLRQLVVSGEACPPELVARWARPGRRMLNVYGPTEATVNTTVAVLDPGRPVTIGNAIDGYTTLILDANMQPVPPGAQGELYVGGPGISRGYLNQPDVTQRSFVRLYRTGDLARVNEEGELEFFGRIDGQVKIRGYRVELAEIEAVLLEQPQIRSAAVRLCDGEGVQSLAAYVVLHEAAGALDRKAVLDALRARLPAYMVPASLDVLAALPMLSSGKVDRRQLPQPSSPLVAEAAAAAPAQTPLEQQIAAVWAEVFKLARVGAEQDFFLDLGGHSLIAAQLIAALRRRAGIHIAVRDVYAFPTVRTMAGHVAGLRAAKPVGLAAAPAAAPSLPATLKAQPRKPGWRLAAVQALYLLALIPVLSLPLIIIVPPVVDMLYFRQPVLDVVVFLLLVGLALWPVLLAIGIGSKWLIIGRYKPGAYPLWGSYYLRWWLVSRLQGFSGLGAFAGTPLAPLAWRVMGAKVGKHCALQTDLVSAWDCISIGDDTSIGADTQLTGVRIENGYLVIGKVEIGNGCFIGGHCALGLDVKMGDASRLDDQSLLADGEAIPAGESRRGSPARKATVVVPDGAPRRLSRTYLCLFCTTQISTAIVLAFLFGLPAVAFGLSMAFMIVHAPAAVWVPILVAAVPILTVFFCVYLACWKKLIQPHPEPGVYDLYSFEYLQFWLTSGMMRAARGLGFLIFTTIYLPPWMRLLGARLGRHTEMSTVWSFFSDMLTAGDGVFFADGCLLGGARMHLGRFAMLMNRIGNRSFIGNSAMLPPGASLGDNCLIGVLSTPAAEQTPDGTDWLGSPGFRLPNRQKVAGFSQQSTYQPTPKLYLQRALVDALRILIPGYLGAALATAAFLIVLSIYQQWGVWAVYAAAPLIGWAALAIALATVVTLKWTVMGTFKPVVVPLWSPYVWANEMLNGIYEAIMGPIVAACYGTPFAAPLLRLLGCRIGRHCYIATNLFSEFDLVDIGDYAALNGGAVVQNHLFEDRIMKSSHLRIGDRASVGNMSVVLYDTTMHERAVLGPLSLLMKGEIMPKAARWHGIPTLQA